MRDARLYKVVELVSEGVCRWLIHPWRESRGENNLSRDNHRVDERRRASLVNI
jgi:hypothetical protein